MPIPSFRQRKTAIVLSLFFLLTAVSVAQTPRPLTVADFNGWRDIVTPTLSPDGHYLVYGLFPQEGDGEVVVKNLQTGVETRHAAGERPEPPPPNPLAELNPNPGEGPGSQQRGISVAFTPDGAYVAFSTFPTHADVYAAKKAKKKAEQMPKGAMVIVNLPTGQATRIERVKNFQAPEKNSATLVYLKESDEVASSDKDKDEESTDAVLGLQSEDQRSRAGAAGGGRSNRPEFGSDMVVRDLASGSEFTIADVLDYSVAKDGGTIVYATSSRKTPEKNGVYVIDKNDKVTPRALLTGKGKYRRLTWDETQTEIAFLSDRDDAASKSSKFKLYRWERGGPAPSEIVSAATPGFREDCVVSEHGAISFSRDGKRIFFGCAPAAAEEKPADLIDDEKVNVDLWSWKDDYIQPMQKVRAESERTRTFRCVYHVPEKKMVQLADRAMPELTPSDDGLWGLGGDDREYRRMIEFDTRYADSYLVNTLTGERKLLTKKHEGQITWAPGGNYTLLFNGRDWNTISVPDGKAINLTQNLPVKFFREDDDHPSPPPAYSRANWTRDGKWVLLDDEFDVWRVAPDGSKAVNLTQGVGRKNHLEFRAVRLVADARDPQSRWIDESKPLLLKAVDKETRDQGFYQVSVAGSEAPRKLLMAAKQYGNPTPSKTGGAIMLTESTFEEFPDLMVTDASFGKLKKVTDANPNMKQFAWGSEELVRFRNTDGVPLSGILYKPANFDPSKKYPMVVYIYEKLSQNFHDFVVPRPRHTINASMFTSNGYLVLMPDIVYTVGHPGQSALKCVLPAIDAVVARGFVNEKAIGIQGHSWGGYQIAYMITQSNRFRAVAAGAPVSNMTSAYDGIRWGPGLPRQFQYERDQSRIGGSLWETPLLYIENSPIFSANRVQTPLLMIHNDADDAVPWYQGIEYYLALRRLGKEVYLFTYNGEPHGLRRRADQKDYTIRLQQWFDYWLKGSPKPDWMEKGIPYLQREQEKVRLKEAMGEY
jgi:dipeptidyl aminopeptidase/acylaminoacyl peptidase